MDYGLWTIVYDHRQECPQYCGIFKVNYTITLLYVFVDRETSGLLKKC